MELFTRREIVKGAGAWVVAQGALGRAIASEPSQFRFVVVNDLHYRDVRCGEWLQHVADHIALLRPRPAFCMLNGDLAESGTRQQLGAVGEIFRSTAIPLHAVIGNHDYSADERRSEFLAQFGKALNYRFEYQDWQFLVLDSTEGSKVYRSEISRETLEWLDGRLPRIDRDRPLVVVTHFPLGRNWLRPRNAGALLARFEGYDLRSVLSGHWHGITERVLGATTLSTGRCSSWWRTNQDGSPLKGYMICDVQQGQIAHRFMPVAGKVLSA